MYVILNVYVFRGKFDNRNVAVKRVLKDFLAEREVIEMLLLYIVYLKILSRFLPRKSGFWKLITVTV